MAKEYFDQWSHSVDVWIERAKIATMKADDLEWRRSAAFDLHQSAERAYICFLLVRTLYFPRSHNIKFLRSLAEDKEPRLVEAWPRATKKDRARFERLKRAYVEARYSTSYAITADDLDALAASVRRLRNIVDLVCRERLAELEAEAAA